jgi:hypothetical protein
VGSIQAILGNNSTPAAAAILHITTTTMANLSIPRTGSTAMGFAISIMKGYRL